MNQTHTAFSKGSFNAKGEWRPPDNITLPAIFNWPLAWRQLPKWFFERYVKGHLSYALSACLVYFILQPGAAYFDTLNLSVIAWMYVRNVVFMLIVFGGWHLLLYTYRLNGSKNKYDPKWQNVGHSQFLFKNQVWDNMFYSLVPGAGIWSAYEVFYMWSLQQGYLPEIMHFHEHPLLFVAAFLWIPFWRPFHFYWVHRLIHWKPLYQRYHALHHRNVNIGPWSGMAMHPVEHLLYISVVLIHWIVPSHPIHFFYNMLLTTLTPASAHSGFEGEVLDGKTRTGDLAHYLHHRYFHYNFGDVNGLPLDKWFGTLHDGSSDFKVELPYEIEENKPYDNIDNSSLTSLPKSDEQGIPYRLWQCTLCAFIYDEAKGLPEEGIAAGTRWENISEDWSCPDCGLSKSDFNMVELIDGQSGTHQEAQLHIVIVGSGLAGYTLARDCRALNPKCSISIFTSDRGDHYSKPMLSDSFNLKKSAKQLILASAEQMAAALNITIRTGITVYHIDRERQLLETDSGQVHYDKLVLATGATPRKLQVEGAQASDIQSINHLDDWKTLEKQLRTKRSILILGAGLIGCEFANDLALAGHEVRVLDPSDHPLQRFLPAQAGRYLQHKLASVGVKWIFNQQLQSIQKQPHGYRCVLNNKELIECELILSAVGLEPNIELAQKSGLDCQRGIIVNEILQSSDPNIYALGDCIEKQGLLKPFVAPILNGAKALAHTLTGTATIVAEPITPITVKTTSVPCVVYTPKSQGSWTFHEQTNSFKAEYHNTEGHLEGYISMGDDSKEKPKIVEPLQVYQLQKIS